MKEYRLYVDETGTSHPANYKTSPHYILVGCIIENHWRDELKILADQIKYKYWGKTDIVFHSIAIGTNTEAFDIFNGKPELKKSFYKDLYHLLSTAKVLLTVCLVDKQIAHSRRWGEKRVVRATSESIIGDFIAMITAHKPSNGKMIFEASNGFKDQIYLATFNYYLSPNFLKNDTDYTDVRGCLTSINFVTKQNHDIETQISDLFSYAAKCKHERDSGLKTFPTGSYETKVIKIFENKLIQMASNIGKDKKKFYKKINAFCIIPDPLKPPAKKKALELK